MDIERRIGEIYQRCRTREEIDRDFEQLQLDFADDISSAMTATRTKLIEHFDAQVHDRLRVRLDHSRGAVDRHQELLYRVMRFALDGSARFDDDERRMTVETVPDGVPVEVPRSYSAIRPGPDEPLHQLRPNDPLAEWGLAEALRAPASGRRIVFDYSAWPITAAELEPLVGQSGVLRVVKLAITGREPEEHLLFAGETEGGIALTDEQVHRLMDVPATDGPRDGSELGEGVAERLRGLEENLLKVFAERKAEWLGGEFEKLDRWAQDERERLRAGVAELEREINEVAKATRLAGTEPERLPLRRKKLGLERQLETARRDFDAAADEILERQETMLNQIEASLESDHTTETLFTTSWSVR